MKRLHLFLFLFCLLLTVPSQAKIIYVDANAPGANNGQNWANAYNYLQDALNDADSAVKPVEIRVAEGIYTPDSNSADPNGSGDRTATFQLTNGVAIEGGYAGFSEPDPNARHIDLHETILSGDLDGDDVEVADPCDLRDEPTRAENSYHVSTANGTDASAILNGLTIAGGNANHVPHSPMWDFTKIRGGGVYNEDGGAVFSNCTFVGNFAGGGGGIYNKGGDLLLVNCTFAGNCARPVFDPVWGWSGNGSGGGMGNRGGNPMLTDCTFSGNFASSGGGMDNSGGGPTLRRCTFSGNSAIGGGGMYNGSSPDVTQTLTDCTFSGNSATTGGGMSHCSGNPTLVNCTFIGNSAVNGGGMFYYESIYGNPTLIGCTFSGNSASDEGGGMYNWDADLTVTNCTLSGNSAEHGGGIHNKGSSPTLTNCIVWGNDGEEINGSPADVTYSDIEGGWPGEGNIDVDPCFADVGYWDPNGTPNDPNDDFWIDGDYHLKSEGWRWDANRKVWTWDEVTSPCIDAGNPGCPLGNEPNEPNNIRINMGAYGGTAEASKTPSNWRNIADLTNDWIVDFNDLKVFVRHWLETGECIPSDLDRSQFVDFNDFAIFGLQWSQPSASEPGMTFQIDDCDMEEGLSLPMSEEPNQPRFSVWVEGRYIHFEDLMYANCCPDELGLDKEINGKQITLYEIGYGGMCDCMCYFPITATLGPFEDGTYTVEVFDNYGKSLGVVEVTIGGSTGPSITYQIEDCNRDASDVFAAKPPDLTRFKVTVEGSYIHFEDMMYANCCPDELELEMTVEDNLITIYEIEYTSEGCRCMCSFPITATLGPFEPGIYTLEVYEDWGGFIASTTVVIAPPE